MYYADCAHFFQQMMWKHSYKCDTPVRVSLSPFRLNTMSRLSHPTTQGGQTFLHRMHMFGQVVRSALFLASIVSTIIFGTLCYRTFSEKHIDRYIHACHVRLQKAIWGPQEVIDGYRASYWVERTSPFLHKTHQQLFLFVFYSLLAGSIVFSVILIAWNRQGAKAHRDRKSTRLNSSH